MPTPRKGEKLLQASVVVCEELDRIRAEFKQVERRMIRRRRSLWLRAIEAPGSEIDRQRIVDDCGVSVQLVDADLRSEREARQ